VINYVWLALVVVAVLYGSCNDLRDRPMTYTPEPQNLTAPAVDAPLTATPLAVDPVELPRKWLRPTAAGDHDTAVTATALRAEVTASQAGRTLRAVLRDRDGDLFHVEGTGRTADAGKPGTVIFNLESPAPDPANVGARIDEPLSLVALSAGAGADPLAVTINKLELTFGTQQLLRADVRAESWMGVLTKSSAAWAKEGITLAIGLIGIMMLWLGLMKIAEAAGMVRFLAKLLKPIMVRLFPDIPADSEAMGAIVMNMAANMMGLGNAATPLGLKAMQELQNLNPRPEHASNAQCMLLALNTSSVTIITPSIIGYRAAAGSGNIMEFWPVMIMATVGSTIAGVLACKVLERLPIFRIPPPAPGEPVGAGSAAGQTKEA
jgi:spore maturation protein A